MFVIAQGNSNLVKFVIVCGKVMLIEFNMNNWFLC
jgi:hypothetical protein